MARRRGGPKRAGQAEGRVRAIERRWVRIIKLDAVGIAKELIQDPIYLEMLKKKLHRGTLHPQLQVMLWGYGYGKPRETVELKKKLDVRIVHEYLDGPVTAVGVNDVASEAPPDLDVLPITKLLIAHE